MEFHRRLFWGGVLLLSLIGTTVVWGEILGVTLLVEHLGIRALALAILLESLLSIALIFSTEQLKGYIQQGIAVAAIGLIGTIILLVGYAFVRQDATIGYILVYAVQRMMRDLLVFHAGNFLASYLEHQSHYLISRVHRYSRVGVALGGLLLVLLTTWFDTNSSLLWVWIMALLGSVLATGVFADEFQGASRAQAQAYNRTSDAAIRLESALRSFWGSPLMRWLSLSGGTMMLAFGLMVYQSTATFWESWDQNALALIRWLSLLSALASLLILLLQDILLPVVLKRRHMTSYIDIYPMSLLASLASLLALPTLFTATLAEGVRLALRTSLYDPQQNQLKNTLPSSVRSWQHTFLEGVVEPLGKLVSGILLVLFVLDIFPLAVLWMLGVAAALGFIYAEYYAGKEYTRMVDQSLAAGEYGILRKSLHDQITTNQELVDRLLEHLQQLSPSDREILLIAEALSQTQSPQGFEALLSLFPRCPPTLQAELLLILAEGFPQQRNGQVIQVIVREALDSQETKLRHAALRAMMIYPNLLDTFRVAQLLIDYDPSVSTLAAQLLLQHPSPELARAAQAQLNWLSRAGSATIRSVAVRALVQGGVNRYGERVVTVDVPRFLQDPSARVRLNALPAAGYPNLVLAAQDVSPAVRQAAIKRLARRPYLSTRLLKQALLNLSGITPANYQIRQVIRYWHLMTALATVNPRYGKTILSAEVAQGLKQVDFLTAMCQTLDALGYPSLTSLIAQFHHDRAQLIQAIIRFIGAVRGSKRVNAAIRTLQISPSEAASQSALETLARLTTPEIAHQINTLLTHSRFNLPLITTDGYWQPRDPVEVIRTILSQPDQWLPMMALYVLAALPRPDFENLVQPNQIEIILENGRRSNEDAIREGTRLLRQVLANEPKTQRNSLLSRVAPTQSVDEGMDMLSTIERMVFLRNVTFFENLRLDQLRTLAQICEELSVNEGEYIIRQGEAGDSLFIIVEGQIHIAHTDAPDKVIAVRHPGHVLGEISLFDGGLRSANAIAATPALLLVVYRDALDNALADDPGIALDMLRAMAQIVREANQSISTLSLQVSLRELTQSFDIEPEVS
jgi:CRP-like cAMP-binding protein